METMSRPNIANRKIYNFKEFAFLNAGNKDRHISTPVPFSSEFIVGTVINGNAVPINPAYFNQLLDLSEKSSVGVGSETVYEPDVRTSNEIEGDQIQLYPQFVDMLQAHVNQLGIQLDHPVELKLQLHKLILYEKDNFFKEHIDSTHTVDMVMTLVVEFPMESEGGELVINEDEISHPEKDTLQLSLFYHDQKHEVLKVKEGRKMSMTFDVIQTNKLIPQVIEKYRPDFNLGIQQLRAKGVRRVGFPANHLYMQINPVNHLKGVDRVGYELFKSLAKRIEIRGLAFDEHYWFFEDIIAIGYFLGGFSVVYRDRGEDDEEENPSKMVPLEKKEPFVQVSVPQPVISQLLYSNEPITMDQLRERASHLLPSAPVSYDSYQSIKFEMDKENQYKAIDRDYLMGDVVLLKTMGKGKLKYEGDEEIHLGNEGFEGTIYENLLIYAEL